MLLQSLKLVRPTVKEEMHLKENVLIDLVVAQYPLHPLTRSPVTFEDATSNGLGGDALTKLSDVRTHGQPGD